MKSLPPPVVWRTRAGIEWPCDVILPDDDQDVAVLRGELVPKCVEVIHSNKQPLSYTSRRVP